MATKVALIQGASRGLGLQFCRHILEHHPGAKVIATCRDPEGPSSAGLRDLYSESGGAEGPLEVLQLDVTKEKEIENIGKSVSSKCDGLDLLINSSGMLHPSGLGERSLNAVSLAGLMTTMTTNALGPLLVVQALAPLLQRGGGGFGRVTGAKTDHKSVVVNMSAKVGSIGDNGLGGWYSYRMSKAALNMATKNLSIELGRGSKRVVCVALHPGTVDTALSRPYHKNVPNLLSVESSVGHLMSIVDQLTTADAGKYLSWDGSPLPF